MPKGENKLFTISFSKNKKYSLGYTDADGNDPFTISFSKNKRWREAKRPLMVYIKIIPKDGPGPPDDGTAKSLTLNALRCCF